MSESIMTILTDQLEPLDLKLYLRFNWLLLTMFLIVLANEKIICAQQNANRLRPAITSDKEVRKLARWMEGDFTTIAQVAADNRQNTKYRHVLATMHLRQVEVKNLAGITLYAEQSLAQSPDRPYRQRVYQITRNEKGEIVNRIYKIKNQSELIGAYDNPKLLAGIKPENLSTDPGCEVVWRQKKKNYYQGSAGANKECRSNYGGANGYTVSEITLTSSSIISLDRSFDEKGVQQWGPPDGTGEHLFKRQK